MRRTRLGKKKVKSEKMINFLAFFVFAPIVAILIGTALVRYIILPQFSNTQKTNDDTVTNSEVFNEDNELDAESPINEISDDELLNTQNITIDGLSIYNIQLGSFSTRENAINFANKLLSEGIYSYVVDLDGYKVFGGSYFTREEAEDYLKEIKKYYEDSFISTMDIKNKEISCYNQDIDYLKKLSELHDLIKKSYGEEVSLWKSVIESNDKELLINFLKSNTNAMEEIQNFDTSQITSKEINNYFTVTKSIIDIRKELLNNIEQANEADIITCYRKFMDIVFKYFKMVNLL